MGVPKEFTEPVVFICVNSEADENGVIEKTPCATGFFVAVPMDEKSFVVYLVTARHIVDESREFGKLYVRLNQTNGGFAYVEVDQDLFRQNPSSDVAVLPWQDFATVARYGAIPNYILAAKDYAIEHKVSEGDEVYIAGLFSEHYGKQRNQPVIRHGRISLMPHEKINLKLSTVSESQPVEAYLVESISWGGESGSPVYINVPSHPNYVLLGLVYGHFPIPAKVKEQEQIIGKVDLNAGMMVVIPAQAIIDTINQEELVEERERHLKQKQNKDARPVPDMKKPEGVFTRDDFMRDLNKVVRKKDDKDSKVK